MTVSIAEVWLWGRHVASLAESPRGVTFRYTPDFASSGIELSPILMPLDTHRVYEGFERRNPETFKGLPPLVIDSLPDRFGETLINRWLARDGRAPGSLSPIERLCYTGARGMGALEFRPATAPDALASDALDVERLVELASMAMRSRGGTLATGLADQSDFAQILSVGTSAGGARAKAIIAWNPDSGEVRSGQQTDLPGGFEHWLLKFDGVAENRDKELADPLGYGRIEYAYSLMAAAAGIDMADCRLLEEGGRAHFMTRRFDRSGPTGKLHYQSLCAMAGFDFNERQSASYEQALQTMRRIGLGKPELLQQARRAAFNIVCRNQDDHTKNIGFLMDQRGRWSLSPAFDVTYSYNPAGLWTAQHQMTLGGLGDGFTRADVEQALSTASGYRRADIAAMVDEVLDAAAQWPRFAEEAGIEEPSHLAIDQTFRRL